MHGIQWTQNKVNIDNVFACTIGLYVTIPYRCLAFVLNKGKKNKQC